MTFCCLAIYAVCKFVCLQHFFFPRSSWARRVSFSYSSIFPCYLHKTFSTIAAAVWLFVAYVAVFRRLSIGSIQFFIRIHNHHIVIIRVIRIQVYKIIARTICNFQQWFSIWINESDWKSIFRNWIYVFCDFYSILMANIDWLFFVDRVFFLPFYQVHYIKWAVYGEFILRERLNSDSFRGCICPIDLSDFNRPKWNLWCVCTLHTKLDVCA